MNVKSRLTFQQAAMLLCVTVAAFAVHGYHPYVEDAEIYLPGIKKLLNPALYPQNDGFFASHAGMTLFPNLIAASIRISHLPFDWALLVWQFGCVYLLLLASWKVGCLVFRSPLAIWGGVGMVASLLTLPVAGTSLFIMDQYLNTRSLSAAAVLMMVASAGERRYVRAGIWGLFTAAIHPLMFVFGASFATILFMVRTLPAGTVRRSAAVAGLIPLGLFPPMSAAYHEALLTRKYFFLAHWHWYELVGLVAPFAIFWWYGKLAEQRGLEELKRMCKAANIYGAIFAVASLLTIPAGLERFTLLQPMRYLHLTYILMFIIAGGLLAELVLQRHVWRWLVLFVPLCAGMFYAQREMFPATPHLELPGRPSPNAWVQAFLWIRQNTPADAYFALNPKHMAVSGEDHHGFRALSERSMLADIGKDSGAVTMFPKLAETWKEQTTAQSGWNHFGKTDFERLKQTYGISWVVLERPSDVDLNCPYQNARLEVCRLD